MPDPVTLSALADQYGPSVAGLLGSLLSSSLGSAASHRGRFQQLDRFSPQQNSQLDQLTQLGLGQLQNPYQGFQGIADQARSNFNNVTVPGLAERFAGSNSRTSSPAYLQQLGAAGAGLDTNLAALQSQYGLQQQSNAQGLLGMGLQPRFDQTYIPGGNNFLSSLLGGVGRAGAGFATLGMGKQMGLYR